MHGFEAYSGPKQATSSLSHDPRPKAQQSELREDRWTVPQIENLNDLMRMDKPQEILSWASENFSPKLKFSCSFSLEDVVLLHLIADLGVNTQAFFIDSGRVDQETYNLIERFRQTLRVEIQLYTWNSEQLSEPKQLQANQAGQGENNGSPDWEALARALHGAEAWFSANRADEQDGKILEIDSAHGNILRINPLANWSWQQIWDYVKYHNLPYHRLYDKGLQAWTAQPGFK